MSRSLPNDSLFAKLVADLVASYRQQQNIQHLDSAFLPNRDRIIEALELLRRLLFPGFFDDQRISTANVHYHVGDLLNRVREKLYEQVRQSLRYDEAATHGPAAGDACDSCDGQAHEITHKFLEKIPDIRRRLSLDIRAAFDGDPAAAASDETVFCYPGVFAIFTHRVAHELCLLKVPMLPRIMSEYAHSFTGIDIHPGAIIGDSFFIDHGTGVVIGETTVIGARVKIYQGVTLGALSTKGGQSWRGKRRHPTIEDDVTIYGGAIILGGETVIGQGSTIGGSVFLTQSVPPNSTVSMKPPELKVSSRQPRTRTQEAKIIAQPLLDFQI